MRANGNPRSGRFSLDESRFILRQVLTTLDGRIGDPTTPDAYLMVNWGSMATELNRLPKGVREHYSNRIVPVLKAIAGKARKLESFNDFVLCLKKKFLQLIPPTGNPSSPSI